MDSERYLQNLLDKRVLKEEDEKVIKTIKKAVSDKQNEFPSDQKGTYNMIEGLAKK